MFLNTNHFTKSGFLACVSKHNLHWAPLFSHCGERTSLCSLPFTPTCHATPITVDSLWDIYATVPLLKSTCLPHSKSYLFSARKYSSSSYNYLSKYFCVYLGCKSRSQVIPLTLVPALSWQGEHLQEKGTVLRNLHLNITTALGSYLKAEVSCIKFVKQKTEFLHQYQIVFFHHVCWVSSINDLLHTSTST